MKRVVVVLIIIWTNFYTCFHIVLINATDGEILLLPVSVRRVEDAPTLLSILLTYIRLCGE